MNIANLKSLPFSNKRLTANFETLKPDLIEFLGQGPYKYSPRNNYTKTLSSILKSLLLEGTDLVSDTCFISVIDVNKAVPYHNNGGRCLAVILPLKNCENLYFEHTLEIVPEEILDSIEGFEEDSRFYWCTIAKDYKPTKVFTTRLETPLFFNLDTFHTEINCSLKEPAIFLSLRFNGQEEQKIIDSIPE